MWSYSGIAWQLGSPFFPLHPITSESQQRLSIIAIEEGWSFCFLLCLCWSFEGDFGCEISFWSYIEMNVWWFFFLIWKLFSLDMMFSIWISKNPFCGKCQSNKKIWRDISPDIKNTPFVGGLPDDSSPDNVPSQ